MKAAGASDLVIAGALGEFRADGYQQSESSGHSVLGPFIIFVIIFVVFEVELRLWRGASRSAVRDVGGEAEMDQDLPHCERLGDGGQDLHLAVLTAGAVEDVLGEHSLEQGGPVQVSVPDGEQAVFVRCGAEQGKR